MITRPLVPSVPIAVVLAASIGFAQPSIDPSGHWEGTGLVQNMSVPLQVDLVRGSDGRLSGTISVPGQRLKGLPLQTVAVEGTAIRFQAREDQPFSGKIADDGSSIAGEMTMNGAALPIALKRTGAAQIDPPPTSPAIGKALEGTWKGTLGTDGGLRLVLTLVNHNDGTASGVLENLDEGGLHIPVAITEHGANVTIETSVVPGSFSGTMSDDGATLKGTYRQDGAEWPLTFTRATPR